MSLSGHQSARMKTADWLTPPGWIKVLGPFDLDPCCPPKMPWKTAVRMLTAKDDGLYAAWKGRVWCNPPFGADAVMWLRRMAEHGNGIALIPARTETRMFYECVWRMADAVCFVKGRPHFHVARDTKIRRKTKPDIFIKKGEAAPFNSGAPICLIAYGQGNVKSLHDSDLGMVVTF